jgi:hypothetical protein
MQHQPIATAYLMGHTTSVGSQDCDPVVDKTEPKKKEAKRCVLGISKWSRQL